MQRGTGPDLFVRLLDNKTQEHVFQYNNRATHEPPLCALLLISCAWVCGHVKRVHYKEEKSRCVVVVRESDREGAKRNKRTGGGGAGAAANIVCTILFSAEIETKKICKKRKTFPNIG